MYPLGSGSYGAVVAAWDKLNNREVSIKMMSRENKNYDKMIIAEVSALVAVQRRRKRGDPRAFHFPEVYEFMMVGAGDSQTTTRTGTAQYP